MLIDHRRILTAAHLGFVEGNQYAVAVEGKETINARCIVASQIPQYDFALLESADLDNQEYNFGQLVPGRKYYILVSFGYFTEKKGFLISFE